jgi:hypothetical protein
LRQFGGDARSTPAITGQMNALLAAAYRIAGALILCGTLFLPLLGRKSPYELMVKGVIVVCGFITVVLACYLRKPQCDADVTIMESEGDVQHDLGDHH